MKHIFYSSPLYRSKQAEITKRGWQKGKYKNQITALEVRVCARVGCKKHFKVKKFDPKKFCSQSCSAKVNNSNRPAMTLETKLKIAGSMFGRPSIFKGKILVQRLNKKCRKCGKSFNTTRWQNHLYCSVNCAMKDIGGRPTSPKAARAKSGIRLDIDSQIYFFSRWEANFARILNLLKIKWVFQPGVFDLKFQKYTPDFYLPEYDLYVEIKNFLSDYSARRDMAFRKLYPDKNLLLILRPEYTKLQSDFAEYIEEWEFS
ncbi:MAG: hypothetical protein Q8P69_00870 [bacterium]|nr:hypothetical protein [bacterium]